jgi:hypothetical protein
MSFSLPGTTNHKNMKIVYRISDAGFNKLKPEYINNENCLKNALDVFSIEKHQWLVIADSVSDDTKNMIESYIDKQFIDYVFIKKGPGYPFLYSLDKVIAQGEDDDIIYFIENDYIHKPQSDQVIIEGVELGANYITLYDHPDKYINADQGGNPFIENGGEITQVFLTQTCHWKLTNSTTGTFASTVKNLKQDYETIKKYADNPYWNDFYMFTELRQQGRTLISPLPGYSTHGETAWLTPLTDWNQI